MSPTAEQPIDTPDDAIDQRLLTRLIGFVRSLRGNGFGSGLDESIDIAQVTALGCLTDPHLMRRQLRSLLCGNRREWLAFDELYEHYWFATRRRTRVRQSARGASGAAHALDIRDWPGTLGTHAANGANPPDADAAADTHPPEPADDGRDDARSRASAHASLAERDFAAFRNEAQQRQLEQLVAQLARALRRRLFGRRRRDARGPALDLGTTLRNALPTGGEPLHLAWQHRKPRPPRLVLVLDVSASMNPYSMILLRFARGLCSALSHTRVFAFHTRLVNLSAALHERSDQRMAARLEAASSGWAGGTRIGPALSELAERHAKEIFRSRPSLLIASDGLDTAEPAILEQALRSLKPRCRRLIWLNPLLGREGYEPLAQGMCCALPYLDAFVPAHNLNSLLALEPLLRRC